MSGGGEGGYTQVVVESCGGGGVIVRIYIEVASPGQFFTVSKIFFFSFGQETGPVFSDSGIWVDNSLSLSLSLSQLSMGHPIHPTSQWCAWVMVILGEKSVAPTPRRDVVHKQNPPKKVKYRFSWHFLRVCC
jgi:hypothetical protein